MGRHAAPGPFDGPRSDGPPPRAADGPTATAQTPVADAWTGSSSAAETVGPRPPSATGRPPREQDAEAAAKPWQEGHDPRRARGTVAALPASRPVPGLEAPTLRTAPVPVQGTGATRSAPVGKAAVVLAALVVAGVVAAQFTAERSVADVPVAASSSPAGTASASTPALPSITVSSPPATPEADGSAPVPAPSAGTPTATGSGSTGAGATPSASGSAPESSPVATSDGPSPDGTATSAPPTAGTPASSAAPSGSASPSSPAPATGGTTPSDSPSPSGSGTPATGDRPTATPSAPSDSPAPSTPAPGGTAPTEGARPFPSATGGDVALSAGRYRLGDFGGDLLGAHVRGDLTGRGSGRTTIRMTAHASSKRSSVPSRKWSTNQLSLVKVSGASRIGGFTLQGSDQGHLYNGLRISRSRDARVTDVRVVAVPGGDDVPPGETFGINDFHTDGTRYRDVEVDGAGVAAAAFGTNSSADVTVEDSWFHDSGHANGATFWQTRDVTVRDTRSTGNHDAAFNFERVSGAVLLDHVTMRGNRLAHLRIDSDRGSATYRIVDPVFDGPRLKIVMTPRYMGKANRQQRSDVHVIIGGVDRTADVVQWVAHF